MADYTLAIVATFDDGVVIDFVGPQALAVSRSREFDRMLRDAHDDAVARKVAA